MTSTDLVHLSIDQIEHVALRAAHSGQFGFAKPEQAFMAVLAGQEIGIGPFAAVNGIHIISGKPVVGANVLARLVKSSGKYDYRITKHDETECVIAYFEGGDHVGDSRFTIKMAERAGLAGGANWKKTPENMLFARAMSNGVKWFCPDVTAGPFYVEGEIPDEPAAKPAPPRDVVATVERVEANGAASEPPPVTMPYSGDVRATLRGLSDEQKTTLKQALAEANVPVGKTQGELVSAICAHVTLDDWQRVIARIGETATDDEQAEATTMFGEEAERLASVPAYGVGPS